MFEVRVKFEFLKYGIVQEFFRNVCGRVLSFISIVGEESIKKSEFVFSVSYYQLEGMVRVLNKKVVKLGSSEEVRFFVFFQVGKDGVFRDGDGVTVFFNEVGVWGLFFFLGVGVGL